MPRKKETYKEKLERFGKVALFLAGNGFVTKVTSDKLLVLKNINDETYIDASQWGMRRATTFVKQSQENWRKNNE